MKKFKIYSLKGPIGESDLEFGDPGMNVYSGHFQAEPAYDDVRSVFKMFSLALSLIGNEQAIQLERYYQARDDLALRVESRSHKVLATNWIHILDLDSNLDELQVEISLNEPLDE
jgi:hypothetical protein